MSRFERIVVAAILALAAAAGALTVASARLGPSVDSINVARMLAGVSVNTGIGVTFTEPMNESSVERAFSVTPRVTGTFTWSGNQVLFLPAHSLAYGRTYVLSIAPSAKDREGRKLFRKYRYSLTTETQHILYRGTGGGDDGRLVLASLSGTRRIIGPSDGTVTDFSLSFDRTTVVFARRGGPHQPSNELWLLSLADGSTQRILRRPGWTMSQPHFSPDGQYIVFLATNVRICQKYYGCFYDRSSPLIYLIDLRTKRLFPFHSSSDTPITNFIDFSPAGYIAYTDLGSALTMARPNGSGVVHIPNSGNSLEFSGFDPGGDKAVFVGQTPSSTGGDILVFVHSRYLDVSRGIYDSSSPAFSSSGKELAYAAYRGEQGIQPLYGINVYTFSTHRTLKLTSERGWSDWSPSWSPGDSYIAYVRSQPQEAMYMGSGQIWVVRRDGSNPHPVGGTGTDPVWVG